jgi:hypothetical protein
LQTPHVHQIVRQLRRKTQKTQSSS